MNKTILIAKKELFRIFSDRKMVFSLYILPVIIVVAIYSIMGQLIGSMSKDIEEHNAVITVVNSTDELKDIIKSSEMGKNADITFVTEDEYNSKKAEIEDSILNGDSDLIVYLDKDFGSVADSYVAGGDSLPSMKIFYNSTENYSSASYSNFDSEVVDTYKTTLLDSRYGDLSMLNAFNVDSQVICKEEKANMEFLSMMLPYMVVMMLFAGVMSVGVDAIAGEKERGTLSSMLISPVKRSEIVAGKLISMAILSIISAVVYCVAMILSIPNITGGVGNMGAGNISFTVGQMLQLVAIMVVLVYFYVGVIGLIATLSPNTRAASSAISPIYIVIIILGMMTMFRTGGTNSIGSYLIPVYGSALAISDLCKLELTSINFLASVAGTLVCGIILTFVVAKAFNSEKLMFNA